MTGIRVLLAGMVVVAGLGLGQVDSAVAQTAKAAGTVTTLQGTANLQRVSTTDNTSQPVTPLKYRESVFARDRITTGDQSLVRILMGGKAVVTVRERSSLTITETAGGDVSTIDITSGKIALAVAKERMQPGQRIDIKTPNAVAGVRGTVVIAEVSQATAAAVEQGGGVNTRFTLLTGIVDVTMLNPNGLPSGTAFTMNPLQTLSITGFQPPQGPRNITPAQAQAAANDYKVGLKDAPAGSNGGITDRQVEQATNIAGATGGDGAGPAGGTNLINQTNNTRTTTDPKTALPSSCTNNCAPPPMVAPNPGTKPTECRSICEGGDLARLRSLSTRPR